MRSAPLAIAACFATALAIFASSTNHAAGEPTRSQLTSSTAYPRSQGDAIGPDLTFDVAIAEPYAVMALQPDGRIIVARNTRFDSPEVRGSALARLNQDGSLDASFRPQIAGTVWSITPQDNGDIMVRGSFRRVSGYPVSGLARLNSNGSIDLGFRPAKLFSTKSGAISWVLPLPSGKYLIGARGYLPNFSEPAVLRLNANGTLDKTFKPIEAWPQEGVALQPDGKILLGNTNTFNGQLSDGMTRIFPNGKRDPSLKFYANGYYWFSGLTASGDIFIDGNFEYVGKFKRRGLTKLSPNGQLDPSFSPRVMPATVFSVIPQDRGRLLISGLFDQVEGAPYAGLARLNFDGSVDVTFTNYLGPVDWLAKVASGDYYAVTRDGVLVKAIFL